MSSGVSSLGRWIFTVEAWVDGFKTWRYDLQKRVAAEQDATVDYLIGAELIGQASQRARGSDAEWLRRTADLLRDASRVAEFRTTAFDEALLALMVRYPDRSLSTRYERELTIAVDPVRARFGSWYEFFPRSASPISGQHGTFSDCEAWSRTSRGWVSMSSISPLFIR